MLLEQFPEVDTKHVDDLVFVGLGSVQSPPSRDAAYVKIDWCQFVESANCAAAMEPAKLGENSKAKPGSLPNV